MQRTTGGWRRLRRITAGTAVIVLALLFLSSGLNSAPNSAWASTRGGGSSGLHALVIPNTVIWLNRSQVGGSYINEYVSLNNSSSPTRIPGSITVVAATCKWVTVLNLTVTTGTFTNVKFQNFSKLNASGTFINGPTITSFKACGANAYWVNYVQFSYNIYDFAAPALGVRTTATLVYTQIQSKAKIFSNTSSPLGVGALVAVVVQTNQSFQITFRTVVNGSTTCDTTNQICSYPQWSLTTLSTVLPTSNSSLTPTLTFAAVGSTGYRNWTANYAETNVSANTALGGFFVTSNSVLQEVFVSNGIWILWIVIAVTLVGIAIGMSSRRRGRRR